MVEKSGAAELKLLGGEIRLRSMKLPFAPKQVCVDGKAVAFEIKDGVIVLKEEATVKAEIVVK